MRITFLTLLFFLASPEAFSVVEGNILGCNRRLQLSESEPIPPKDYLVDIGEREGVREGALLKVYRLTPAVHSLSGETHDFVRVFIIELKVLAVGEYSSLGRVELPKNPVQISQGNDSIRVGDIVQLSP